MKNTKDTIYAAATPVIKSGIAIIRVSGEKALESVAFLTGQKTLTPRLATLLNIRHPQKHNIIDNALALYFKAPQSFTGEDVLEYHLHGSIAVINEVLELLGTLEGFRLAEAGEFSKRAFYHGKMDLTQAEGLADLIEAETTMQARQAANQLQGKQKKLYDQWRKDVITLQAHMEAYIDFPDEDIPLEIVAKIQEELTTLIASLTHYLDDGNQGEKLRQGLTAIILGAPNAGKSSLMNALAKRDVAIVSDIAGTTRDMIEVHLDLRGLPLTLIDTAGLREEAQDIESEGIKRALTRAEEADLKIILFDSTQEPDAASQALIDENSIVVMSKSEAECAHGSKVKDHIAISVKENTGLDQLISTFTEAAQNHLSLSEAPIITRRRHREQLEEAKSILDDCNLNAPYELTAEQLRRAAVAIGKITGHIDVEDILDVIFGEFCIGK